MLCRTRGWPPELETAPRKSDICDEASRHDILFVAPVVWAPAMFRSALIVAAAPMALYGASGFVAPASSPAAVPDAGGGPAAAARAAFEETASASGESSWSPLAVGAALGFAVALLSGRPALAADVENGKSVFSENCAACHARGNNIVAAEKTLRKAAMEQYLTGGCTADAIKTVVTNGKGSMPAYKLGPDDLDDVAAYVLEKSTKW